MVKFTLCIFVSFVVGMLCISCDDDCPACPDPEEIVSDYDVYLSGLGLAPIYKYNTRAMTITDSIIPETYVNDIAISSDGRHLLVAYTSGEHQLVVYELETMDTVHLARAAESFEVSNTGKYIALFTGGYMRFLDGSTYEILFTPGLKINGGRFLLDDTKFYCLDRDNNIRIYDMESKSLDTMIQYVDNNGISPELYGIQPDATGGKIFFFGAYYPYIYTDTLLAYDIELDSTTFAYHTSPPGGDIRLTPDGKLIIVSDPGSVFIEQYGTMDMIYVNPETDELVSVIPSPRFNSHFGIMPGLFTITPDCRHTVVASAAGAWAFGMIDNRVHSYVDLNIYEPQTVSFAHAACQKQIK